MTTRTPNIPTLLFRGAATLQAAQQKAKSARGQHYRIYHFSFPHDLSALYKIKMMQASSPQRKPVSVDGTGGRSEPAIIKAEKLAIVATSFAKTGTSPSTASPPRSSDPSITSSPKQQHQHGGGRTTTTSSLSKMRTLLLSIQRRTLINHTLVLAALGSIIAVIVVAVIIVFFIRRSFLVGKARRPPLRYL